ncbi:MAG: hypothetical protein ABSG16_15920 [Candidatus Acidiferrum sp.]
MSTVPASLFSEQAATALASNSGFSTPRSSKLEPGAATDTPREHKLRQAAQQFESMLMSSLWKSMKSSFDEDDDDASDPATATMQDWGMEAMASAVGKAGGLGIGRLIMKDLQPKVDSPPGAKEVPGR